MNQKYTVEIDDEYLMFYVVEWSESENGSRIGTTVSAHLDRTLAIADCNLLNEGYEYEMSAICATEYDEVTV